MTGQTADETFDVFFYAICTITILKKLLKVPATLCSTHTCTLVMFFKTEQVMSKGTVCPVTVKSKYLFSSLFVMTFKEIRVF